jgi:hypothetical protein|tara:strand:- start:1 stop:189 length:189 start_codon:yes stop_codon:yes gene_type:complete
MINVKTAIEILSQIKDKTLLIKLSVPNEDGENPNFWLHSIFVHNKGDSGYEENGEVELWGEE